MCGRFTFRSTEHELQDLFDVLRSPPIVPRYNIAPTQSVLTFSLDTQGQREGRMRHWGLIPRWATDASGAGQLINARSESVAEKPTFRESFLHRRCLIPASGFFEWQAAGRSKQPWLITRVSGELLTFAGLWEVWQRPDGTPLESCTILTTTANEMMAQVHQRMPVILAREQFASWLSPATTEHEELSALLKPCPEDWLQRSPVSPRVNNVRNDDPECLASVPIQRGLF